MPDFSRRTGLRSTLSVALWATFSSVSVQAVETSASPADCADFEWNMANELALFKTTAHAVRASADAGAAVVLRPDLLYEVSLSTQSDVRFVQSPEAHRVVEGPQAGIAKLEVATPGHYRISASSPVWIDVLNGASPVVATAFNGHARCSLIHKSVDFNLPAGVVLVIQFSQSPSPLVRVSITPAP